MNPENQNNAAREQENRDEIRRTRIAAQAEVQAAADQAALDQLAQDSLDQLQAQETTQVQLDTKITNQVPPTPEDIRQEKGIKNAIIRLLEFVRSDVVVPPAGPSRDLFQILQRRNIVNQLNDVSSVFLMPILNRAARQAVTYEEVRDSYDYMIRKNVRPYNSTLVDSWKEVVRETGQRQGMTDQEISTQLDQIDAQGQDTRGISAQREIPLSPQEKQQYNQVADKITQVIASTEHTDRPLYDKLNRLEPLLSHPERNAEARRTFLQAGQALGLTEDDLNLFNTLSQRIYSPLDSDKKDRKREERLDRFNITDADFNSIDPKLVKDSLQFQTYFKTLPDGSRVLTPNAKRKMNQTVYNIVNKVLAQASANTSQEWQDAWNPYFEGQAIKEIKSRIYLLATDPELKQALGNNFSDFNYYVTNTLMDQVTREVDLRKTFFNIRKTFIGGALTPEKIMEFAKGDPASYTSSVMMGDPRTKALFQIALSEFERYIQYRITTNDNKVPADLFGGFFKFEDGIQNPDVDKVRKNIYQRINKLKQTDDELLKDTLEGIEDWEINRVLTLAPAFSMLGSMRLHEIVSTGLARSNGDYGGLYPFMQYFDISAKWRIGRRGGKDLNRPGHPEDSEDGLYEGSGFKTPEIFALKIPMLEDHRPVLTRMRHGWMPKKWRDSLYPWMNSKQHDMISLLDQSLLDGPKLPGEITFAQALKEFNVAGPYTKGGWRIESLKQWFKEQKFKDEEGKDMGWPKNAKEWRIAFPILQARVGAGSLFQWNFARAGMEVEDEFLKLYLGANYQKEYTSAQIDAIYNQFQSNNSMSRVDSGAHYEKTIGELLSRKGVHVPHDAHGLTIDDFTQEKANVYKGKAFKSLLERSPLDFMMNISQLEPQLGKTFDVEVPSVPGRTRKSISAYEFYFNDNFNQYLSSAQRKEKRDYLEALKKRWNGEYATVGHHGHPDHHREEEQARRNMEHLRKIASTWDQIYKRVPLNADGKLNKGEAENFLYQYLASASDKVKLLNKERMDANDIESNGASANDQENVEFLRKLFFSQNGGLVPYFDGLHESFGDKKGEELQLGSREFFYTVANRWWVDKRAVLPNTNEVNQSPYFEYVAKGDEQAFTRFWSDIDTYNKVSDLLVTFDETLLEAARTKNIDKIMELHKNVQTLEGKMGIQNANRLNYIIATTVTRFFQEDYKKRFPFPINFLANPFVKDRNRALSTIHGGIDALSWKEEDIRNYAHHLWEAGYLQEKGKWSMHQLELAVGADTKKYRLSVGFSIVAAIAMVGFMAIVKKMFDELDTENGGGSGAKKKSGGGGGHGGGH